jgi:hypothetical protein
VISRLEGRGLQLLGKLEKTKSNANNQSKSGNRGGSTEKIGSEEKEFITWQHEIFSIIKGLIETD